MMQAINSFLELIYPEKNICQICNTYDNDIGSSYICKDCLKMLEPIQPPYCTKCNKGIEVTNDTMLCEECIRDTRYFEQMHSPYRYKGTVKKLIHDYKYCNKPYYYKLFSELLINYMQRTNYYSFDIIISVPLHRIKLTKRGYNQSSLIAKYIGKYYSIPYLELLKRNNYTIKQSELSKAARQKNIINSFSIKNKRLLPLIHNKNILIIDDIFTTGATINECSRILLQNGVQRVYALTIAR